MKELTQRQCQSIILGSTLFSTGGGLTLKQQQLIMKKVSGRVTLKDRPTGNTVALIPLELGAADTKSITTNKLVNKLLNQLANLHIHPDIVLPAEMGQESIAFLVASILDIPTLDTDMAGGRAAPRLPINIFTALGLKFNFSPVISINANLKVKVLESLNNVVQAEDELRNEIIKNDGVCFIAIIAKISRKIIKIITREKTVSRALQVGQSLKKLSRTGIKYIQEIEAEVIGVKRMSSTGFSGNIFSFMSTQGKIFTIINQNENLILLHHKHLIAEAPTIITIFDLRQDRGLHCSEIKTGIKVKILLIKPLDLWQTRTGKQLWETFALNSLPKYMPL